MKTVIIRHRHTHDDISYSNFRDINSKPKKDFSPIYGNKPPYSFTSRAITLAWQSIVPENPLKVGLEMSRDRVIKVAFRDKS